MRRLPLERLCRAAQRVCGRSPFAAWLTAALGCSVPTDPPLNAPPIAPAWAIASAITLDVDLDRGVVTLVHPGATLGRSPVPMAVVTSRLQLSPVGVGAPPGQRRLSLDLSLTPTVPVLRFTESSLVTRPPGGGGAVLIPYDLQVIALPGGVRVEHGNEIVVELPSAGRIVPSPAFDGDGTPASGAPFPFFTTRRCKAMPDHACFRYETFSEPAQPRRIGFDLDPTVRRFRVKLLVATDVVDVDR